MEKEYVLVYADKDKTTQLPPPSDLPKKKPMFEETYVDYIYAAMSLFRFVLLLKV